MRAIPACRSRFRIKITKKAAMVVVAANSPTQTNQGR
jgi:hypothetical protein